MNFSEIEKRMGDPSYCESAKTDIRSLCLEIEIKNELILKIIAETNCCVDSNLSSDNFAKIRNLAREALG